MLIRLVYLLMVRVPAWLIQVLRPGGIRRGSARALIARAGEHVPEFRSLAVADNLGPTPPVFPGAFAMRISPPSPAAAEAPAPTPLMARINPVRVRFGRHAGQLGIAAITAVRVCSRIAVRHRQVLIGSSAGALSSGQRLGPLDRDAPSMPVTGRLRRCRRRPYKWRAGRGCRGPGRTASWSAGPHVRLLPEHRATGPRHLAPR
jgi:hypothetical protein